MLQVNVLSLSTITNSQFCILFTLFYQNKLLSNTFQASIVPTLSTLPYRSNVTHKLQHFCTYSALSARLCDSMTDVPFQIPHFNQPRYEPIIKDNISIYFKTKGRQFSF